MANLNAQVNDLSKRLSGMFSNNKLSVFYTPNNDGCLDNYVGCNDLTKIKNQVFYLLKNLKSYDEKCVHKLAEIIEKMEKDSCRFNLTFIELDLMMTLMKDIDVKYYYFITAPLYKIVYRDIVEKIKDGSYEKNGIIIKEKSQYNALMMENLKNTRIFFYDSKIFDATNFLNLYVVPKFSARFDGPINAIYPKDMAAMGLSASYESYFAYLFYLMNSTFLSISDILKTNDGRHNSFFEAFNTIMEHYVFIPENLNIIKKSEISGVYDQHNMSIYEAKQILFLIMIFITELQAIFFNVDGCDRVAATILLDHGIDAKNKYIEMYRYISNEKGSVRDRVNRGYGDYKYKLFEYENEKFNNSNNIDVNTITPNRGMNLDISDRNFMNTVEKNRDATIKILDRLHDKDNNFTMRLKKAVDYLRIIKEHTHNNDRCLNSLQDLGDLIQIGQNLSENR